MRRFDRRTFMSATLQIPLAALVIDRAAAACVDPEELSDAASGMRDSMSYVEKAADPKRACNGCAYFKSQGSSQCGNCEILGGVVDAIGHCDSWTPRP